jgi:hypothetical protein
MVSGWGLVLGKRGRRLMLPDSTVVVSGATSWEDPHPESRQDVSRARGAAADLVASGADPDLLAAVVGG